MISSAMGANVIGVDIKPEALALARSLGAVGVVNGRESKNVVQAVRDLTHGGAHVSLDTLGSAETCSNSIKSLRKRGRHVQVGLMVADYRNPPVPMARVLAMELEIYGSHGMQAHAYAPMLQMILAGKLRPGDLVRQTVPLEQAPAELEGMGGFAGTGVTVIDRF
jgi:alcohol dehydrogenase